VLAKLDVVRDEDLEKPQVGVQLVIGMPDKPVGPEPRLEDVLSARTIDAASDK